MNAESLPVLEQHLLSALSSPPQEIRRLFHGRGRCWPGLEQLTVDWLQNQLLVSLFKEPDQAFLSELRAMLARMTETEQWQASGAVSMLLHYRDRDGSPLECLWGVINDYPQVKENGHSYQLDLGRKQNNGLFLDMRNGRQWVHDNAKGMKVLNLFAYTCGFSVAAIAGGADSVVNLDMARAALERGRESHRLNGHNLNQVRFLGHDLFKSWGKVRKLGPYDMVIIDPPTFQKGSFALTRDYRKILRRLPELLTEEGLVLACVNDPYLTSDFLIDEMNEEAPDLKFSERLPNPPEFEDINPESSLKAMVFRR
ncbi:class I SAM-dependent methyltransferase [Endozoicomonas numazuensis]|uniref:Methyltransferase n=1 Tax=Endozoicomonas numazuensis TaxID=1137799 RepID=A0A081NFP3_9GAMM|nr:class I SAM-dependent methyltransferase [Endozoicomonas numazuensis]KEQ17266.1 methyltransferase [Endozoicomonas numazuensis]